MSHNQPDIPVPLHSPQRRDVLKGLSAAALAASGLLKSAVGDATAIEVRAASTAVDRSDGLTWLPAWQLREMIVKRAVSSVEVVEHFLNRIEEHDSKLNAFRKLDAQAARAQAERADKAVKAGEALGPLHGVPIGVKELFTVRGLPIPGSYFDHITGAQHSEPPLATRDDIEIERLRASGAIFVGVTVAAAALRPGMSDPARLPRNPWDTSRTPGSTSAGNGAAVAAGLLPIAIGDDGGGSVRVPSAFCGLLGLHPTRGRIPHVDYKSAAPRLTVTVGPMARNVRDAALTVQVLAGPDGRDFICLQDEPPDYLAHLDSGVSGMRFAWTDDFGFDSTPEGLRSLQTISVVHAATRILHEVGGRVAKATMTWENPVLPWLAAQQLASGTLDSTFFERDLSEKELIAALECRQRNWQRFRKIFTEYDFVISPTVPFTAPKVDTWIELWKQQRGEPKRALAFDAFASPMMCNLLGIPAVSIPAGFVDQMPVGLQVIGKPGSEAGLLQVAQTLLAGKRV
jgi:aspartyl-tRNA(Asn)/glutamyl-tRNA(Gln) amidotransferase subunit A